MKSMLSNHKEIKIHNKKISGKSPNTWKLNNILLNNQWVKKGNKGEIRKYLELNEKNATY